VAKYRIEPLAASLIPGSLDGRALAYGGGQLLRHQRAVLGRFQERPIPGLRERRSLRIHSDNGSREWKELHERAKKGGFFSKQRVL